MIVFTRTQFGHLDQAWLLIAAALIGGYMAMNIGATDIAKAGGIEALMTTLEGHCIAYKGEEVRDLYHAGAGTDGKLSVSGAGHSDGEWCVAAQSRRL